MSNEEGPATSPAPSAWARTSGLPISMLILGAVLIALIGFGVGYLASGHDGGHRHRAFAPEGRAERGAFEGIPGPVMGPGMGDGVGSGSGTATAVGSGAVVAGAVTSVDGSSFAIRTFRGDTISVHTSDATVVRLASAGALSALKPGQIVFVSGTRDADGTIEASRVLGGLTAPSTGGSG